MGALGAATGLGVVLGPALGGLLGGESLSTPFFLTTAVCLLTLLLVWLFLPESLPAEARRAAAVALKPAAQLLALGQSLFGPLGILLLMALRCSCHVRRFPGRPGLGETGAGGSRHGEQQC